LNVDFDFLHSSFLMILFVMILQHNARRALSHAGSTHGMRRDSLSLSLSAYKCMRVLYKFCGVSRAIGERALNAALINNKAGTQEAALL
jgi:hypothetical protein